MIINQNIKPERQAYFLGSKILGELAKNKGQTIEAGALFLTLSTDAKISYHAFSMAMNWLFLIGAIDHKNGEIIKCF